MANWRQGRGRVPATSVMGYWRRHNGSMEGGWASFWSSEIGMVK